MKGTKKTKSQLIDELVQMRQRIAELEASEAERKRAEEALSESENRYKAIFDNRLQMVYINDGKGLFLDANDYALERLGYTRDDIRKVSFQDIVHPDDLPAVIQVFSEILTKGSMERSIEIRLVTKSGEIIWVETFGIPLDHGVDDYIALGIAYDITERKRAEKALQESEHRYRLLAENVTDVIWAVDANLRLTYVSPSVTLLRGYSVEEAMAQRFEEWLTPASLEVVAKILTEEAAGHNQGGEPLRPPTMELELTCKDGSTVWTELRIADMLDQDGQPVGILGISRDITERKRVGEALQESEERLRALIQNAPDAIYTNDLMGNFTSGNRKAEEMLGYSQQELIGENYFEKGILPEEYATKAIELLERNRRGEPTGPDEFVLVRKDGSRVVVEISTFPVTIEGKLEIMGIARDITERKRTEDAVRESEEKLRFMFESIEDAIMATDLQGNIVDFNEAALRKHGYTHKEEITGRNAFELISPKDRARLMEDLGKVIEGDSSRSREEYTLLTSDGSDYEAEFSYGVMRDSSGNPAGLIGVMRDITERKRAEEALKESEELSRGILNTATVGIYLVQDKVLQYVSPEFEHITGYTRDELTGTHSLELVHPEDRERVREKAIEHLKGQSNVPYEYRFKCKDGGVLWILERVSSIVYKGKQATVASFMDITERKRTEETIKHMAYHDTLTDLPNRLLFNEILTLELARAQRNQQQVAVMLLDLDEFKHVNDTLGHPVGDQLLKAVADRMRRSVRKGDTVARMGGDEFMLVLPEMSQAEDAARIAQKLMAAFTKPFVFQAHKLHITSSIGVAIYPLDGENSETLIKNADIAMYRAKEQGRNNYQYYTTAMNGRVLVDS